MDIDIEWQEPIQLTRHKKILVDENDLPAEIEIKAGVYFFSRKYGNSYVPFYIGETISMRGRLRSHLKSKRLADVLRGMNGAGVVEIKAGERYFHYGYFKPKRGKQDVKKCIKIVQKYMVREALAQNVPLLNIQLTLSKTDTINFSGTKKSLSIYPRISKVMA